MSKLYDIAVVGAGPGGISAVVEAKVFGLKNILMIEKGENHSQTIRNFYKNNKRVDKDYKGQVIKLEGNVNFDDGTKESTIDYFDRLLESNAIDFMQKTEVEGVQKSGDVLKIVTSNGVFETKNVVIAIGKMGKPNKPSYKIPSSIRKLVNFNLDNCKDTEKILIVGGGNSAAEYALDLCERNNITLNYRRDGFTRLNELNETGLYDAQEKQKLTLKLGIDIKALDEENGKVKVIYDNDTSEIYDRVIYAIGGTTPVDFLKKCGIKIDEKNNPVFDENFQTDIKGQFVAGDIAATKGGSIALALNHSYKIINHIRK